MKNKSNLLLILLVSIALSYCGFSGINSWDSQVRGSEEMPESVRRLVQKLATKSKRVANNTGLAITYPYDGAVFPPEIAAPVIVWDDANVASNHWLIVVEFSSQRSPIYAIADKQDWAPDQSIWEAIKANSIRAPANITVYGFDHKRPDKIIAKNSIRISTSRDRVDASIFYRQVQLPFKVGKKNFKKIKWRLGDISSYEKPPVVMENLPVCASCHLFSKDGTLISMEMNYKDDSGAHFITPVRENIELSAEDFISWNDFPRPELLPKTRGLSAKISPSGKYMVSTVHEISYAALSNYFPRYSPDGNWIVFTRSRTGIMLQPDSELFIIPAAGGEPRRMHCNRELFNSWHSFSPNGKWMLFTSKANTPFTEIFLTHIDANGVDSPPVCLSRFSDDHYAANVPEFVNIGPGAIK
jgi:hypothetical protein